MTKTSLKSDDNGYNYRHFSWTAVIAGAFVGTGLGFLLNLFSLAIGLSMVKNSPDGVAALAVGGFIGLLIGTIASMFTAGFTAGFLGSLRQSKRNLGVLYGFTAWCAGLLLMVILSSQITRYVSAYTEVVTNHASVVEMDNGISTVHAHSQDAATSENMRKVSNNPGTSMLLIFGLFFIGAVSSCLGGHYGEEYRIKYCRD